MQYRFAEKQDYSDYASGRVFTSLPGMPAFPVRLSCEVFQQCYHLSGARSRITIYDPCCGSAYHLVCLAFLFPDQIGAIYCSDVDEAALSVARKNLSLLTPDGMQARIETIENMIRLYRKESHAAARKSALRLSSLRQGKPVISCSVFHNDILSAAGPPLVRAADVIFTDVPYGNQTSWITRDVTNNPLSQMLESLLASCHAQTIVAVASDRKAKPTNEHYRALKRMSVGKRRISIMKPVV